MGRPSGSGGGQVREIGCISRCVDVYLEVSIYGFVHVVMCQNFGYQSI